MKMTCKNLALLVAVSIALAACGQSKTKSSIGKEQSEQILTAYLKIKEALVKTDGKEASKAAKKLVTLMGSSKDKLGTQLLADAENIGKTTDAKQQRTHFEGLSDKVYKLVKNNKSNTTTLYVQYCPMAFDNKGASWLSTEKQIYNPYFGDMMLHCGKVKETLSAKK